MVKGLRNIIKVNPAITDGLYKNSTKIYKNSWSAGEPGKVYQGVLNGFIISTLSKILPVSKPSFLIVY